MGGATSTPCAAPEVTAPPDHPPASRSCISDPLASERARERRSQIHVSARHNGGKLWDGPLIAQAPIKQTCMCCNSSRPPETHEGFLAHLGTSWTNTAQLIPESAKLGPISTDSGRTSTSTRSGRRSISNLARSRPNLTHASPELANVAPNWPTFGRIRAGFDQFDQIFACEAAALNERWCCWRRSLPNLGNTWPTSS